MKYHLDNEYTDKDKARTQAGFAAYAQDQNVPPRGKPLYWNYRDDSGECIAHLEMFLAGHQAFIKVLWVDENYRGEGLAKQLMHHAEGHARLNDITEIWVDTLTFQAPDFYFKLGYDRVAEVPDYLHGHARVFLKKSVF